MRTVSLKMADSILDRIDAHLERHNFTTRTEFIREAIRDKLQELESDRFESEIRKYFRHHSTELGKEINDIESDVFRELENRFGRQRR